MGTRITAISILAAAMCVLSMKAQDGTSAYNFLNITESSHVYGLGGVNVSLIEDDINIIGQNPALLGPEYEKQLGINYMRYIGESNFAGVRFGMGANEHSAWAAGIQYFGYGDMIGADEAGNLTGKFSAKDICISATYSHDIIGRWRGGITLKGISSTYETYSAFALAADLGVNYYDPEKDLSFSVTAMNLGGQIKRFNDSYDRLPIDLRIGFSKGLESVPFRFSVTAWNLTKWHLPYYDAGDGTTTSEPKIKDSFGSNLMRHLVFGAEYIPSERLYVGIGYNYKTRTDMSTYQRSFLSGFSVCAGLNTQRYGVGIALSQPHTGATTFMLNLAVRL